MFTSSVFSLCNGYLLFKSAGLCAAEGPKLLLALSHTAPALLDGPRTLSGDCLLWWFWLLASLLQILLSHVLALELISQLPAERKLHHDPKDRDLNQRTEGWVQTSLSGLVVIDSGICSSWRTWCVWENLHEDPAAYTCCSSPAGCSWITDSCAVAQSSIPVAPLASQRTAQLGSCFLNTAQCATTGKAFHTWLFSTFKYKEHFALKILCASIFLSKLMCH